MPDCQAALEMQDFGQHYGLQNAYQQKEQFIWVLSSQHRMVIYSFLDGSSFFAATAKQHKPYWYHRINKFINQPIVPWA